MNIRHVKPLGFQTINVAAAVLSIAVKALDAVTEVTLPNALPDYTSEHFDHAPKRNDPAPDIDLSHKR